MKIIHVVPSSGDSIVGIERHVLCLANAQKSRGSTVMMATSRPGVFSEACQQYGIPVLVAAALEPSQEPLEHMSEPAVRELMGEFKSFGADVVHCHTLVAGARVAVPAANLAGIACAITFNGAGPLIGWKKAGLRFVVLCDAKEPYERMRESPLPKKDLYYVPNGTKAVPVASPENAGGSIRPDLVLVGSLAPKKAIENAILTMAELRRRRGPDCPVLNIYGDGPLRNYLLEIATVLELNDIVRFHGTQFGILERCPSTDILLMSSRIELGPLVVQEAMSRGMPIVATDVGEVTDMLPDSRYGRVVPIDSIVLLADAVESLLSDIESGRFVPELLSERHREFYSDDKMAERVEAVYKQAIANESATARTVGTGPRPGFARGPQKSRS